MLLHRLVVGELIATYSVCSLWVECCRFSCGTVSRRRISIRCCDSHCLRRIDPDVKIAFIESDRINRDSTPNRRLFAALVPCLSVILSKLVAGTLRAPASVPSASAEQITH